MRLHDLLRGLPSPARFFRPAQPTVAAELTEEHLALARVARGGSGGDLLAWFVGAVPPGVVKGSPTHSNVLSPDALAPILRVARDRVAAGGPLALCLPDIAARVALIPVDAVPRTPQELRETVAWRLKRSLAYKVEEAVIDARPVAAAGGKTALLAAAVRRKVLADHEALFEAHGFHVGTVTLSTLALADWMPEAPDDSLLLNVGAGWFSILLTRGPDPIFYRCKPVPESERGGAQRDWFIAGELLPTLEYYRDRLAGQGLARVLLHVSGAGWDGLRDTIASSLDAPISRLGVPASPGLPAEVAERLGPAAALASRGARRETPLGALSPGAAA